MSEPEATTYQRQREFAANVRRYDIIIDEPMIEVWDVDTALDKDDNTVVLVTPRGDDHGVHAYWGGLTILRPDDPPKD